MLSAILAGYRDCLPQGPGAGPRWRRPGSPPLEENFGYVENIRKQWLCRKPLDCNDVPLAALQQSFKINCVPDIQQNPTYSTAAREFFIL